MIKGLIFREDNKKKNYSIFDAIGYKFAIENEMIFVTGDKAFKGLPKVKIIT